MIADQAQLVMKFSDRSFSDQYKSDRNDGRGMKGGLTLHFLR